jgi:hypothetical protein
MRAEIKEVLKNELKAVQKSKTSILIGIAMVALDIILVITSIFSVYTLIAMLPLVFIIRKQIYEYRINRMVLIFMRCLVDDEYKINLD